MLVTKGHPRETYTDSTAGYFTSQIIYIIIIIIIIKIVVVPQLD